MGCAISSGSDQLSNVRVFDVANIDDGGQERSAGKIEVAEAELILHYPGRQSIRWPLQSLRRYGYNDHLFSFESGRRCPTGHGIYAFRCVNAEMLFHQLQQAIVRAGEERARNNAEQGTRREDHYLPTDWSSIGSVLQQQRIGRMGQFGQLDNRFADYISYPHITASWRTYVNQHIANHHSKPQGCPTPNEVRPSDGSVQYADLDLPVFCDAIEMEDYDEEADVFQSPDIISSESSSFRSTYVNVPIPIGNNAIPLFSRESRTTRLPGNAIVPAPLTSSRTAKVTYAQLDLDTPGGQSSEGTAFSPGSSAKPECTTVKDRSETYAAIDFQRTRALSTKTTESEDEGFRKTRHNSNIEMLTRN